MVKFLSLMINTTPLVNTFDALFTNNVLISVGFFYGFSLGW